MRPTGRVEALLVLALFAALGGLWYPWAAVIAWGIAGLVFLGCGVELLGFRRRPAFRAERQVVGSIALGSEADVELVIENPGRAIAVQVFDHVPTGLEPIGMPRSLVLPAAGRATIPYAVRASRRGYAVFEFVELHVPGALGLLVERRLVPAGSVVCVLPDFQAVRGYELLAVSGRQSTLGIRRRPRRGAGLDFHQLRDWQEGDSLRQVDWKATSRRGRVIAKEYQEERDQRVVFLLDRSRRMRATDGDIGHFDHVLNAVLLLTSVAARQGDAVGLFAFGAEPVWCPPRKGAAAQTAILRSVVDLEPTLDVADYAEAATQLLARQRKRTLVILATNLGREDWDELEPALRVLERRHLVLVANLREAAVEAAIARVPTTLPEAQTTAAALLDRDDRRRLISRIRARGTWALDVEPEDLPIALVNGYLDVKSAGAL
ncbi:MAG: DUF58 domain-containing protein [Planctomycetota bacterium]